MDESAADVPRQGGAGGAGEDERGEDLSSRMLATRLERWRERSAPLAIIIGGPDGLDPVLKSQGHEQIRLSSLTLPHPLVRHLLQATVAMCRLTHQPNQMWVLSMQALAVIGTALIQVARVTTAGNCRSASR